MKTINKEYLEELKSLRQWYENYLKHYKDWSGTLEEFLDLDKVGRSFKQWVFFNSIPKEKLSLVAADLAERVLHVYESKHPNDDKARKAIEVARSNNAAEAVNYADYADYAFDYDSDDEYDVDNAATDALAAAYAAAYSAANVDWDENVTAAEDAAEYVGNIGNHLIAIDADTNGTDHDVYVVAQKEEEKAQLEVMKRYAREALKDSE
jgi:hypothetical protein